MTQKDKKIYENQRVQLNGFINRSDYNDFLAQKRGFKNDSEYRSQVRYEKGIGLTMSLNNKCSSYLGVFIAERLLPDIFDNPIMMPHSNEGYDAICKSGYKIDVKSSVLYKDNLWKFAIKYNKKADAFLCIAFDNRVNLQAQHIWLIPGNEIIRKRKLNELTSLGVYNTEFSKAGVIKYELTGKINEANEVCTMFKNGVLK